MILTALGEVGPEPVVVTFSVPGGEAMAAETTNARLGILGGISILGTSGVVRPFSTASYRASVVQQIDVAAAQGERTVVLATGARSEAAGARLYPHLDPVCLVEVGDFTGIALRRCARAGMDRVIFVGMAGKLTKLAAGVMMTHFHRSDVDTALLAALAREVGAPAAVVEAATATATARHFFDVCMTEGCLRRSPCCASEPTPLAWPTPGQALTSKWSWSTTRAPWPSAAPGELPADRFP